MKLKKEFITHSAGEEAILVPSGEAAFSGVVRGNRTLGAVLELLKEDTDEAAVVAAMKKRFDAPEGAVERDVARVLAELRKIGALEEEAP